jgi:hypothetical protein
MRWGFLSKRMIFKGVTQEPAEMPLKKTALACYKELNNSFSSEGCVGEHDEAKNDSN